MSAFFKVSQNSGIRNAPCISFIILLFLQRLAKGFNKAGEKIFAGVGICSNILPVTYYYILIISYYIESSSVKQTNSAIIHGDESTPVYTDLAGKYLTY